MSTFYQLWNDERKSEEWFKCAMDPIYFINNYGYAFNVKSGAFDRISCFEYQEKVIKSYLKFRDNIILKSRQTGISVITAAYVCWRLLFKYGEKIIILANDGAGAKRFLQHVKTFILSLPDFLKPGYDPITKKVPEPDKWNDTRVEFCNMSYAEAKAASKDAGRGGNYTCAVLDEFAFVEKDRDIWTAVSFALSMTKGDCIMISTPYGSGNLFFETWTEASRGAGKFNPIRVHWTENPVCSEGLVMVDDGKGKKFPWSPWYEEQKSKMNYDSVKIAQELDLSFLGSKLLAVSEDITMKYRDNIIGQNIKPAVYYDFKNDVYTHEKTPFWIWKLPAQDASYIIGADPARGAGKDFSTIQILNSITLEQVAEFQGQVDPDVFADLIYAIANRYNQAYVVVEGNSFGLATTYKLTRTLKYKHVFHSKSVKQMHVRPQSYSDFIVDKDEMIPGFQTTYQSKIMVVDTIRKMMRDGSVKLNSLRLLNEFETWIMEAKSDGRVTASHEQGRHDDLIMALGIALYVWSTEFQNLEASRKMMKNMLDAFSFSANGIRGTNEPTDPEFIKKLKEKKESGETGSSGILFSPNKGSNTSDDQRDDDINDISWLLG